jgi:hypothetical protein
MQRVSKYQGEQSCLPGRPPVADWLQFVAKQDSCVEVMDANTFGVESTVAPPATMACSAKSSATRRGPTRGDC